MTRRIGRLRHKKVETKQSTDKHDSEQTSFEWWHRHRERGRVLSRDVGVEENKRKIAIDLSHHSTLGKTIDDLSVLGIFFGR